MKPSPEDEETIPTEGKRKEIESELRRTRERLVAANAQYSQRANETAKAETSGRPVERALIGAVLIAALEAADAKYRDALAALKLDSSNEAQARCEAALIEFNRLL